MTSSDPVNPSHYADLGEYSAVHVVRKWGLGYNLGQTLKYIQRAGRKDPEKLIEDLQKAKWYLDWHIDRLLEEKWYPESRADDQQKMALDQCEFHGCSRTAYETYCDGFTEFLACKECKKGAS